MEQSYSWELKLNKGSERVWEKTKQYLWRTLLRPFYMNNECLISPQMAYKPFLTKVHRNMEIK